MTRTSVGPFCVPAHALRRRSMELEWMDELSIQDTRLTDALADLRLINLALGGYSTSLTALSSYFEAINPYAEVNLLDIGCGGGDFAAELLLWSRKRFPTVSLRITAIDNSPATIEWAGSQLKNRLPADLFALITLLCCDAFAMPFDADQFNIAHASLFMHHFPSDGVVKLLREMNRTASDGIVINDLHRHPVALGSITAITRMLKASAMVQHDGPLSVRRAFSRDELVRIATVSGLKDFEISWRWAFRWLLSTVTINNV